MINDKGWICAHRNILDNPFLKKPNYLAVWMYIILRANHSDNDIVINDKRVTIQRGSFLGSIQQISQHFKLPISSVHKIITCFENDKMLNTTRTRNYTVFRVLEYERYQKGEHKMNTGRTAPETNNNDNNDNKPPIVPQGGQKSPKRISKKERIENDINQAMLELGYDPSLDEQEIGEPEIIDIEGSDISVI